MKTFKPEEIKLTKDQEQEQEKRKQEAVIRDLATISCEEFYNIYGGKNAY